MICTRPGRSARTTSTLATTSSLRMWFLAMCSMAMPAALANSAARSRTRHVVGVQVNRVDIRRRTITAAPAHDVPGAGSEEVLPRHRGEGRLDLRISDAGGRRDLLPIGPPDDLQFALAIHLGRIWLVRRSGQDSTAFECRVLAANRNPVCRPDARRNHVPLVRTRPHAAAVRTRPCTPPPEARGGDAVSDHRSLREEREQF